VVLSQTRRSGKDFEIVTRSRESTVTQTRGDALVSPETRTGPVERGNCGGSGCTVTKRKTAERTQDFVDAGAFRDAESNLLDSGHGPVRGVDKSLEVLRPLNKDFYGFPNFQRRRNMATHTETKCSEQRSRRQGTKVSKEWR